MIERGMGPIYVGIFFPDGLSKEDALLRARALLPCATGDFEEIDAGPGYVVGNMGCETGYYEAHEDGASYGSDDVGVKVEWRRRKRRSPHLRPAYRAGDGRMAKWRRIEVGEVGYYVQVASSSPWALEDDLFERAAARRVVAAGVKVPRLEGILSKAAVARL